MNLPGHGSSGHRADPWRL